MPLLSRLRRDARGLTAVEFALLAPVLFGALIGVAQLGILFFANAGLANMVGEGARYATIFPRPTTTQIQSHMVQNRFGLKAQHLATPTIATGNADGANFLTITATYQVPLDFIFFTVKPVSLTHTRRVYVHAPN